MDPEMYHELPEMEHIAVLEFEDAMQRHGIFWDSCEADPEDGTVAVTFSELEDAESLLALAVKPDATPGTMYDRAAGGCVSLATIPPEDDDAAMDVIEASWVWMVHPFQAAGVICWHVTAVIPASDVLDMAAALNAREVTS